MARRRTGTIREHTGKDGRVYRSLRYTEHGERRYVALGNVTREVAERCLYDVMEGLGAHADPLFGKVRDRVASGSCWSWTGNLNPAGYGTTGGDNRPAHRFVYERLVGTIPEGHVLHHICGVKHCVNPAHLRPMTPGDHARLHAKSRADCGFMWTSVPNGASVAADEQVA